MLEGLTQFFSVFLRIAIFRAIGKVVRLVWQTLFGSPSEAELKERKRKSLYGGVIDVEEYKDRMAGVAFIALALVIYWLWQ